MGRRRLATGILLPQGAVSTGDAPPIASSQSPLSSVSACGENCARSLAPPFPTARGAAGAPFGLAQKENAPRPVEEKKALVRAPVQWPSVRTGVGVSVPAPIWAGLRARYPLLRGRCCRPVADSAQVVALNCFSFRCRWSGGRWEPVERADEGIGPYGDAESHRPHCRGRRPRPPGSTGPYNRPGSA